MTLIGRTGVLKFIRQTPEPSILPSTARNAGGATFNLVSDDYWSPDQVVLLGKGAGGSVVTITGYMYRDVLDRVTLHSTQTGALNNTPSTALSLSTITTGPMALALLGTSGQTTVLSTFINTAAAVTTETGLRAYPATLASYLAAGTSAPPTWNIAGELRSWTLDIASSSADINVIGDKFSTAVKTVISGSGSLDFLVRLYTGASTSDATPLLRLALMTERGSEVSARFYIKPPSAPSTAPCATAIRTELAKALFYEATLLITNTSIDMTADDLVAGSADFVTTGPIRLKVDD